MTVGARRAARRSGARTGITLALALAGGCPSDPLDGPRRLEARGEAVAAGEAYLAAARADPALLAAWEGAIRIFCRERHDVGRCLAVLDHELELLGRVEEHAEALAEALEDRARMRLEQGLVDAARSDLERAERVAPRRGSVHAARARLHLALGEVAEAKARLHRARELDAPGAELEALWALVEITESSKAASGAPTADPSEPDLPAFGR